MPTTRYGSVLVEEIVWAIVRGDVPDSSCVAFPTVTAADACPVKKTHCPVKMRKTATVKRNAEYQASVAPAGILMRGGVISNAKNPAVFCFQRMTSIVRRSSYKEQALPLSEPGISRRSGQGCVPY